MQNCRVAIETLTDGKKTKILRAGKLSFSEEEIRLSYVEENAKVFLLLKNGEATVERQGDYTLYLPLSSGKITLGKIGTLGSEGEIPVQTDYVRYVKKENGLEISLRYRLLFGEEGQDMRLHLQVKF